MDWKLIVGEKFAAICHPEKIIFPPHKRNNGLLYVATSSGFALELSFLEPMIIDTVNKYFGYNAVQRLIICHKAISSSLTKKKKMKQISQKDHEFIQDSIKDIEDSKLKITLYNLGLGIFQK